jgi:hypothetical protein
MKEIIVNGKNYQLVQWRNQESNMRILLTKSKLKESKRLGQKTITLWKNIFRKRIICKDYLHIAILRKHRKQINEFVHFLSV